MFVLEGLVGLHRTIQLQLLHISGWGIDLDYHDIEWLYITRLTKFATKGAGSLNIKYC